MKKKVTITNRAPSNAREHHGQTIFGPFYSMGDVNIFLETLEDVEETHKDLDEVPEDDMDDNRKYWLVLRQR